MAVSLTTEDKLEYNFYPSSGPQLQFRIKAPNDAHLALTTGPGEGDPMWEVFIGGWGNTRSVIRKNRTKPDVVEVPTPDILTADEFRGFWIRWTDNGVIMVGKEGEHEPFMMYEDPEPFCVTHFGVCTGWGASGEWLIEADPIVGEPNPNPTAPPTDHDGSTSWVDASNGVIPPGAVQGGEDDEPLYVGRANHEGEVLPGKVKPSHGVCYVSYGGGEHGISDYQVLCSANTSWVPTTEDNLPPNALPCGHNTDGEPLFSGRVKHEGSLTLGKVQASHKVLYIPYGGDEISYGEYEVLVLN